MVITATDLPVTIGRSHRADIAINDPLLSRIHARIEPSIGGDFTLVDNDSTNLTIVNEADIDSIRLRTGDVILLGDTTLFVEIDGPNENEDPREKTTREISCLQPEQTSADESQE